MRVDPNASIAEVRCHERAVAAMGWLFDHRHDQPPSLFHGAAVDVGECSFFEGCYAAAWSSESFDEVSEVFGSGMRKRAGAYWFVPPSHPLESLFVCIHAGGYGVSNSLAFLVAHYDVDVPFRWDYPERFATIITGIDRYERLLIDAGPVRIERVVCDNFAIDAQGRMRTARKPAGAAVTDFASYRQLLQSTLARSLANAAAPTRRRRFQPLSTCSSGYDSATGAALARPLGCERVVTLRSARGGADDSGVDVASALGMTAIEVERADRVDIDDDLMSVLSNGLGGEDYCFRHLRPLLPDRVLLTGFHGDRMWNLRTSPNTTFARQDRAGCSLQELRLTTGFCHVPLPMIAARQAPAINAISRSREMTPFRVGGRYDRPIPRRILEEAGVPRHLFGQAKQAGSTLFFRDSSLLSADVVQALTQVRHETTGRVFGSLAYYARAVSWQVRQFGYRALGQLPILRHTRSLLVAHWGLFEGSHPRNALAFMLGVKGVAQRYANALSPKP